MQGRYAYNYARIDLETRMCKGVQTTTVDCSESEDMIPIPVYDEEYICKYYINGSWWWDAEATRPWKSALLQ